MTPSELTARAEILYEEIQGKDKKDAVRILVGGLLAERGLCAGACQAAR